MNAKFVRRDFRFSGKDRKSICAYSWDGIEQIRGIVQIFHGMSEHALRYQDFAFFLNGNGFAVFANDHRGHGKTAGNTDELGVIGKDGFNMIVEDEYVLFRIIKEKYPDKPVFVFGHSFGSFVAQEYITRYGEEIAGVVLSGSAMQKGIDISLGRRLASVQRKLFGEEKKAYLLSSLSFGTYNRRIPGAKHKFAWLSTDDEEVVKYEQDPYCGAVASIGFYYYMLKAFEELYSESKLSGIPSDLPILILSGEEDPVGVYGKKVKKLYNLYQKHGLLNVGLKLYPGMRHEILNERNRDKVYADILDWLVAHAEAL
ncbi:lysophospholipase PldB [Thermoclostridium stercorarium subsp. stercorarium DSM 8532]|uniref:Lysophospholipase PldB n=1 Tax=Thermoclostridium stercorarium (strain ATCC 35414 / DSM 8532 / NCIMB 11754) TaxID=1121335 RepID=L7VM64_THES1|nr:alpha/beta hydrolase [Thermoclostridium stercorarium]AGC67837.1 lysophospholipase PldB [Thermoclostridium stercorarium subsp. stercorarium DSM 8532]